MKRVLCFALLFSILWLTGCKEGASPPQGQPATRDFFAMNTYISLSAYGEGAEAALHAVQEKTEYLEALWSVTDENSEIYEINHSTGQEVSVREETFALLSFAMEMAEKTNGALEPTIYPVLTAWGFTTEEKRIPDEKEIGALLKHVGYERIILKEGRITIPDGVMLDIGAVGKGYASVRRQKF